MYGWGEKRYDRIIKKKWEGKRKRDINFPLFGCGERGKQGK